MGKGIPLQGDRSAWDADGYPEKHANDTDTADGIHHTLGMGANQAAAGDHSHNQTAIGSYWNVRAKPSTAHAMDDEFDDNSLGAKWTEFDPGAHLTVAENSYGLVLTPSASSKWGGVYQTLPSGDFSVTALMSFPGIFQDGKIVSIILWEDPTDTSKRLETFSMLKYATNGYAVQWNRWTNYTTFNTNAYASGGLGIWQPTYRYMRMRRNGSTYYGDLSDDGINWSIGPNGVTLGFTPTAIGVGILSGATFSPVIFPFFRCIGSDVTLNGVLAGRRVNIYG